MSDEVCPSCQAPRGPGDRFCWMCGRPWGEPGVEASVPPATTDSAAAIAEAPVAPVATNWTLVLLLLAMGMVLAGAFSGSGASLTLGVLILIPAMLMSAITGLKGFRGGAGRGATQPSTLVQKLVRAVGLVAAVFALLAAAGVAVVIALFAVCFVVIAGSSMR